MRFEVDREVVISVPISSHVKRRFHASPGKAYDAALPGEGDAIMGKYIIEFVDSRDDEEISALYFEDHPPFVDFWDRVGATWSLWLDTAPTTSSAYFATDQASSSAVSPARAGISLPTVPRHGIARLSPSLGWRPGVGSLTGRSFGRRAGESLPTVRRSQERRRHP